MNTNGRDAAGTAAARGGLDFVVAGVSPAKSHLDLSFCEFVFIRG